MSRRILLVSLIVLVAASVSVAGEMPETAWFDMENCEFCKNLSSTPKLLDNMSWEQYSISNGVVAVTTVAEKYLADYRKAHAAMVATGESMGQGAEMPKMCGSCTALGMCMMKGLKQEYVQTKHGDVWIMTSENPELVKEVQAWAKRNAEEIAKM